MGGYQQLFCVHLISKMSACTFLFLFTLSVNIISQTQSMRSFTNNDCPAKNFISREEMATPCYDNRDCSGDMICCETLSGKICLRKQISNQPNYYSRSRCQDGSISSQSCDPGICPPNYKCENGKCCWNNEYAASPSQSQRYTTCRDGRLPSSMCQYGACPPGYTCENGKCCENTDYYTTSSPTTDWYRLCPGGNRAIHRCNHGKCAWDEHCYNNWCCKIAGIMQPTTTTTTTTVHPVVKSGRCPPYLSVIGATTIDRCSMDGDCEESQKCCNTSLGKRCMFPEM